MIDVNLQVNKSYVYDEVAKTTSYTGAKMQGDEGAYLRIFTTDDDRQMLERFWAEACSSATELLKPFIVSVSAQPVSHTVNLGNNYDVTLQLSTAFDTSLSDSINSSLFSFFVSYITGKWYKFTNKAEANDYIAEAESALEDIKKKIYYRKKPTRVSPI
jgi:hypothetical protein